jgi:hypothetical protein
MKRTEEDFDEKTVARYYHEVYRACEVLENEAKRAGAPLKFQNYHFTVEAPQACDPKKGFSLLKNFFSFKTTNQARQYYTKRLDADETPFLLVFDEWERSFSWEQTKYSRRYVNEVSVIFRNDDNFSWRTIAHELLHQYGAVDFYFPEEIQKCADACLGQSLMGYHGERVDDFPTTGLLEKAKPILEVLPGWKCDIRGIRKFEDLPENARKYVEFIEKQLGFPITMVSNGPGRDDIIYR